MKKIYVLSLGCPRNLVDSEVLIGKLKEEGFSMSESAEGSEVAIVNTCAFIEDARKESIDHILQLAEMKKSGMIKRLVVTGCLSQRYPSELMDEIKEIDGIFGTSDFLNIPGRLDLISRGERLREVGPDPRYLYDHTQKREILTAPYSVYVKIQEGCSNRCSYCVIPDLKGPRRSREISSIVREVGSLRENSPVKEIVLIGQDTTSFGMDTHAGSGLAALLREVSAVMDGGWVRLLYTHPAHFSDELIDTMASAKNICRYVDLPIQHINDGILKKMNRRVTRKDITGLIGRIRQGLEGVVLRTSVIVGFPGETEDDIDELIDFLERTRFDRLGAFIYSREDGTPAGSMPGQVPLKTKQQRFDRVMRLQQRISQENNEKLLGSRFEVLVEEPEPSSPGLFSARSYMDAPEVDGVIYIKGDGLETGQFADVRITGAAEYDLTGEAV
jgi:ribosomal protein S12 methylthiotransferase